MNYATREAWLQDAAGELAAVVGAAAGTYPNSIRIACGFPSTHRRSGALGETFAATDSADSTIEVLISPTVSDPLDVLAVLTRQLCQAAASNAALTRAYAALGIAPGKPRDIPSVSGINLSAIAQALGAYPHATLSLSDRPKSATRLLKGQCPTCGYTIRVTQKWATQGMPTCHCGDLINLGV